MAFAPIAQLENPAAAIVPHPCSQAAENRNTDAIRRILKEHYTEIRKIGTRLARAIVSREATEDCDAQQVSIGSFELMGEDDPDDPIEIPQLAHNEMTIALKDGVKVYMAYDPTNSTVSHWKIFQAQHSYMNVVTDVEKSGSDCTITLRDISAPTCDTIGQSIVFSTVTQRLVYDQSISNDNGCSIVSSDATVEVFDTDVDPVTRIEYSFDNVNVLTDVYQVANGTITGYYYRIYAPCITLVGEDPLIYTTTCVDGSGG